MRTYTYRRCKLTEIDKLQAFIDRHWRHRHILSTSAELVKFQHYTAGQDELTFAVAENIQTGEFDGIYGYIPNWKYAPSHGIPNVQWGAIWKTRDDVQNDEIGKVGLGLLRYILKSDPAEVFASLGLSAIHKSIAKKLGYVVGQMRHYYIPNRSLSDFRIIKHPDLSGTQAQPHGWYAREISFPWNFHPTKNINPYKDIEFFEHRYLKHPVFTYRYLGVYCGEELQGVFVFRSAEHH